MLSFQEQYTQCQDLAQDTDSDSLTFFKNNLNTGQRQLEVELGSFYTEETHTDTTVASDNSYKTPARYVRLKVGYVTVDSTRYPLEEVQDEDEWQSYQAALSSSSTSDIAQKIFVRKDNYYLFPTPASAGNTITLIYEASSPILQNDDYTTGTITTLANAGTAVTASGSTFTAAMAGRYFKINADGVWYKIASFGTTTTLTLDKPYEGTAISAGSSAYTIGEMPITPEDTHIIPVYYALWQYYQGFKQSTSKGAYYKSLYEQELARAKSSYARRYSSKYIPPSSARGRKPVINPNWYPELS